MEFFVLAATTGSDESLDIEYDIDPNEGGTTYRLCVAGSHVPLRRIETDEPEDRDDLVPVLFAV